jgi:hypothetical protein
MEPAETKELALCPLFSLVIAERVLIVTARVDGLVLLVLSISAAESRSFVSAFVFANSTFGVGGTYG